MLTVKPSGAIAGRVVDVAGAPVPNCEVSARIWPCDLVSKTMTDKDGSYYLRGIPGDPSMVERFEGYIAGFELCNAFTELNDPLDQEARFLEMGRDYNTDDEERHPMDEDYLRAMRYGMPPCGGFGMGVDRLTMLLTDSQNIREVILFPHLRKTEE